VAAGKAGEEALSASDTGPLAAYVWKTTAIRSSGKYDLFRVASGTIQADSHVWIKVKNAEERLSGLHIQRRQGADCQSR